jgi:choline dehydrogenase
MKSFDFVVIGAGSAGSIIAARLSEDPEVTVLLLEAGRRDNHPFMSMPIAFPKLAANRSFVWPFETEPEPGLNNRTLPIWRGKTLGGCSSINAMINVRGNRYDYDNWRQLGLEGWGYRDVLPYFRKLEKSWRGGGLYHGSEGPIGNEPITLSEACFPQFERAAIHAGLKVCSDHHGAEQEGISRIELTTNSGRRASSARAYLYPAMRMRQNLSVLTQAQTTRIVLDGKRATGVEYVRNGRVERVHAHREIVLCGGPYNSPQLLMLSGIGPADHLRSVGIDVIQDLKGVGENLQEHPNLLNIYRTQGKVGLARHLRFDRAAWAAMRWMLLGSGPFATAGTTANIFIRTRSELQRPDVQIIAMPVHQHAELWFPFLTKPPVYAFTARVGILHALSRGWVRLRSSDALEWPRIRFNMFAEPADLDAMVAAVKISRDIFSQCPMPELIAEELLPGKQCQSDGELAQAIRQQAEHRHHAVGTCRMGTDEDAVVDSKLRVIGIEKLRVADASVMPTDPSGNTNVPTMMIGEKAADLLRGRTLEPAEV